MVFVDQCLKGSSWFALLLGLSMLTLSVPLTFPMYSPYLSLMTMRALALGYPFISFFHCGYKIKHNLRVCPYVFFAFLCYHFSTFNPNVSTNRCQHEKTIPCFPYLFRSANGCFDGYWMPSRASMCFGFVFLQCPCFGSLCFSGCWFLCFCCQCFCY